MSTPVSELPALHTTGTFPELAKHNHGLRMDAVIAALTCNGIQRVIDLGCGDGALRNKITASNLHLDGYVGIDNWPDRLDRAQSDSDTLDANTTFLDGSMTDLKNLIKDPKPFRHLGAVVLLETIEHVPGDDVSLIESGVFGYISPDIAVVTTPDATERLNDEQLEARGHFFEWDVPEFEEWAAGVTSQYPEYSVKIDQLSGPTFVRNTQIAVFSRVA